MNVKSASFVDMTSTSKTTNPSKTTKAPDQAPAVLDFGVLPRGRTQLQRFQIQSTDKTSAECKLNYSEQNAWFQVISMNSVTKKSVFPLNIIVEVDTSRLPPGRRYDGWIAFNAGDISARIALTVQVVEPVIRQLFFARLRKSALLGLYMGLAVAVILLISYFYPLRTVSLWSPAIQASTRLPLADEPIADHGNQAQSSQQHQEASGLATSELLFSVYEDGQLQLYAARGDGTQQQSLQAPGWSPVWSPDGQFIAYIATQGDAPQIFVMDLHKRIPFQLTNSPEEKSAVAWSSDQQKLAFIAGKPNQGVLKILNVPEKEVLAWARQQPALTHEQVETLNVLVETVFVDQQQSEQVLGAVQHFSWSPDGQSLLFDLENEGKHTIFKTSAQRAKLFFEFDSWDPAWSPDGNLVAVTSKIGLYTVDAHGQDVHHINSLHASAPAWSPDGTLIAFLATQDSAPNITDLWLTDRRGRYQAQLTTGGCLSFAWSPAGDHLAYLTGNRNDQSHSFYLWLIQPGQTAQLIAEVGEPHIAWKKIDSQ